MEIEFSGHAELKIAQRKLRRADIVEVILHPDFREPGTHGREELFKKFRKNYLKVVILTQSNVTIVITAHWVAKAREKY